LSVLEDHYSWKCLTLLLLIDPPKLGSASTWNVCAEVTTFLAGMTMIAVKYAAIAMLSAAMLAASSGPGVSPRDCETAAKLTEPPM